MENSETNLESSPTPSTTPAPSYGAGTDPTPYIAGAYGVGVLLIIGFAVLIMVERRHLRMLMNALKKNP